MNKAFPWKGRDGAAAEDKRQAPYLGEPRNVLADDVPARLYGAQLTRVESTLNSLLAAVAASAEAPRPAWQERSPQSSRAVSRPTLGAAIAEIGRRQRNLEVQENRPAADYAEIRNRVKASAAGESSLQSSPRLAATSLSSLQSDIAALAGKLDDMRREQAVRHAEPAPVCNLDRLRAEIATMSEALRDLASRGSVAALESAIRGLSQKIETSRTEGIKEAVLQPLETLVSELRLSLAQIDPRMTIKGLEGELKKLGIKLDDLGRSAVDPVTFQNVQKQTAEIRDLLTLAVAHPLPVERIEHQVAQLADSIDRQRSAVKERGSDGWAPVDDQAQVASFAKIEIRLDAIAAKVEEAVAEARDHSRYQALSNRIDDVHHGLTARIAETGSTPSAQIVALEDLVRGLADKLETAQTAQSDTHAVEALERQISALAERLDRSNAGLSSLGLIENAIGDLFAELEKTRQVSLQAAETAARQALQDVLADSPRALDRANVDEELNALRSLQDQAERRTLSTLNAVHETLEKVVDRLAMVEEDLSDKRANAHPELLTSGPAPVFAPHRMAPEPDSQQGTAVEAQPRRGAAPGKTKASMPPAAAIEDFLIEPGTGFPGRRAGSLADSTSAKTASAASTLDPVEAPATRSDFIAAARRAAQAAQTESLAALQDLGRTHAPTKGDGSRGIVEQTRHFIAQHKRPVVLSLAALFVAVGAYAVVKTMTHAQPTSLSYNVGAPVAADIAPLASPLSQQRAAFAAAPTNVYNSAPLASPAPVDAPDRSTNKAASPPGSDPMVTGSITSRPRMVAPATAAPSRQISLASLRMQANAGLAQAQFLLAADYTEGRGVPRDLRTAAQWYSKAAAQGLAPAQYHLASFYEKGVGVTRDVNKARALYRKAAEQGNVRAMHNLAVLAADGGDSGKPDYATAASWFEKAAEHGVRDSQYNVAVLLARGLGVSQNLMQSYTWFAIAAAQGDEDAGKKRDDVGARLTDAQVNTAKAMAAAFRPKPPNPAANDVQLTESSSAESALSKGQRSKVSSL